MAGKVQAADDDAACQEAAPGGHEVDGEPEFFTLAARDLCGPEGLAAGQAEYGALCAARGRQLVPGLGEGALSQRDVLWAAVHGLRDDSVETTRNNNLSEKTCLSEVSISNPESTNG